MSLLSSILGPKYLGRGPLSYFSSLCYCHDLLQAESDEQGQEASEKNNETFTQTVYVNGVGKVEGRLNFYKNDYTVKV